MEKECSNCDEKNDCLLDSQCRILTGNQKDLSFWTPRRSDLLDRIKKLELENDALLKHLSDYDNLISKMKCCLNCINYAETPMSFCKLHSDYVCNLICPCEDWDLK